MQVEEEKYDSHEVFTDFAANGTFARIVTTAAPSPNRCSKRLNSILYSTALFASLLTLLAALTTPLTRSSTSR